jgi:hypothetical protein
MLSRFYEAIFCSIDRRFYDLPKNYIIHGELEPLPEWEIDLFLDKGESDYFERREPYILPAINGLFDYRSLLCNIFIGDTAVAFIAIDEINDPLNNRDYSLAVFLKDIFTKGLKRTEIISSTTSQSMDGFLKELLKGESVDHVGLENAGRIMGWRMDDPFVCMVAEPVNPLYGDSTLKVTAEKIAGSIEGIIYTIFEHRIVVVLNSRLALRAGFSDVEAIILKRIANRKSRMRVGQSLPFSDLHNLVYFYDQAVQVIALGQRMAPVDAESIDSCYRANDYLLDLIIDRFVVDTAPEALIPVGLAELIKHDKAKGRDLTGVLHEFLRCDRSIARTARQLYLSRSSLIAKIRKIDSILQMDLENADTRLLLVLSLKAYYRDLQA